MKEDKSTPAKVVKKGNKTTFYCGKKAVMNEQKAEAAEKGKKEVVDVS